MYFDGTGDYLSIPDSSDWDLTGDFTIEFWFNLLRTTGDPEGFIMSGDDNWKLWYMSVGGNPKLHWEDDEGYINASTTALVAGQWYHTAIVRSGTTVTMYIDGASEGTRTTTGTISGTTLEIGRGIYSGTNYYIKGYMDEIRISDSARYTGTFTPQTRGNPFTADANTKLLIHSDYTGGLGADSSGNYNHFTATNLVATDQCGDTPTNNFNTWNPLWGRTGKMPTLSEGNTEATSPDAAQAPVTATFGGLVSGKWYTEVLMKTASGDLSIGVLNTSGKMSDISTANGHAYRWYNGNGNKQTSTASTSAYGNSYTSGDIIGIALDMDNGAIYFSKNGTWQDSGDPTSGASKTGAAFTDVLSAVPDTGWVWNVMANNTSVRYILNAGSDSSFAGNKTAQGNQDGNGVGDFFYEPPSGFLALCSKNLPVPEIKLPGENFETVLYTGDGSTQAVSGVGFQPDFVWLKNRNSTGSQMAYDSIRGQLIIYIKMKLMPRQMVVI